MFTFYVSVFSVQSVGSMFCVLGSRFRSWDLGSRFGVLSLRFQAAGLRLWGLRFGF